MSDIVAIVIVNPPQTIVSVVIEKIGPPGQDGADGDGSGGGGSSISVTAGIASTTVDSTTYYWPVSPSPITP